MADIILQSEDVVQEEFYAILEELEYEETKTSDIKPITVDDEARVPKTSDLEPVVEIPAMSSLCRLCATRGIDMVSVFNQNKQQPNIVEKVKQCLSITLKKSDILPKQICSVCLRKLELSSQFHKTVKAAEQRLLKFVKQTLLNALRAEVNDQGHSIHTAQGIGALTVTNRDENDNGATDISEVLEITDTSTQSSGTSSNLVSAATKSSHAKAHDLCENNKTSRSRTKNQAIIDSANFKNTSKTVVQQSTSCYSASSGSIRTIQSEVMQRFNEEVFGSQPTSSGTTSSHTFLNDITKGTGDDADDDIFLDDTTVGNKSYTGRSIGCKILKCETCGEAFQTIKDCYTHSSIHFSTNYYPCCFCDKTFSTEAGWRKHSLQHTEGKTFTTKEIEHDVKSSAKSLYCNKCNLAMDSEISLRQHILMVHNQRIVFWCNVCKKVFKSGDELNDHKEDQDCSFKCTICKKKFNSNDALRYHRKSCWLQVYLCADCGKSYQSKWNLEVHMRQHTGERPYSCDICGMSFRVSEHLRNHAVTHSNKRPYRCSVCGKSFKSKSTRYTHMKIHTGEKPHRCDICGMSFRVSEALRSHASTHSNERPYRCSVCGKSFKSQPTRYKHMKIHTGDKPYQCDLCGRWFRRKFNMQKHRSIHGKKSTSTTSKER